MIDDYDAPRSNFLLLHEAMTRPHHLYRPRFQITALARGQDRDPLVVIHSRSIRLTKLGSSIWREWTMRQAVACAMKADRALMIEA